MTDQACDVLVIGAGIAGTSAAAELARTHRVIVLEREAAPGYHSTGRSAALFSEIYGSAPIRALSRASRSFFFDPPQGFAQQPLVRPRGSLYIANTKQIPALEDFVANPDVAGAIRRVSRHAAMALCPILKPEHVEAAVFEPDASDVDVHSLHDGYLRLLKARGGVLVTDADVQSLERRAGSWRVRTPAGVFSAPILVNAAGAWADVIAAKAGVRRQAITPRRRTALLIELPPEIDPENWPLVVDIDETVYFRPDAGLLMLSPADETPVEPCDVQPEEIDIAVAIDRFERITSIKVERLRKKWAGLRSFGPDRSPVIGYDPAVEGFFWLAGQGGYGIQSAPAAAQLAAALVRGERVPETFDAFDPTSVSPARRQNEVEAA